MLDKNRNDRVLIASFSVKKLLRLFIPYSSQSDIKKRIFRSNVKYKNKIKSNQDIKQPQVDVFKHETFTRDILICLTFSSSVFPPFFR